MEVIDPASPARVARFVTVTRRIRRRRERGLSLIEALFAVSVVLTGLLVIESSVTRSKMSRMEAEQRSSASATLQRAAAALHALGITQAWQEYSPSTLGLPYPAPGSGSGPPFVDPTLCDAADPSVAASVVVRFFTDETKIDGRFGLPRDLDGDGAISNQDTAQIGGDGMLRAKILPYELLLSFRGPAGGVRTAIWDGLLTHVR